MVCSSNRSCSRSRFVVEELGGSPFPVNAHFSIGAPDEAYDVRLLYRTFPIKWNRAKLCSLWLASLRNAAASLDPPFFPLLVGFLLTREDNCSSITAPLISPREHVMIISSIFLVGRSDGLSRKCWFTILCSALIINVGATGLKLHEFSYPAPRVVYWVTHLIWVT